MGILVVGVLGQLLVRVGMRVSVNVNVGVMVMVRMRVMVSVTVRVRLHACPCLLFPWGPERSRSLETQHRERGMRSPRGDGRGPFRLSNHLRCAAIALVQAVRSFVQRSRQLQTGRQGSQNARCRTSGRRQHDIGRQSRQHALCTLVGEFFFSYLFARAVTSKNWKT